MATTITAGNSTNGAAAIAPDNTGILELKTGSGAGTTAMTIGTGQQVAVTLGSAAAPAITFADDTNTGIYSPGADRIGFTEGGTQVGEFDASGNFLFNSGYGSVARAFGCRAWVNFNGTGTVAIRASGNVSSITDNGIGDYTVNFTTAMPNTNYCFNLSANDDGTGTGGPPQTNGYAYGTWKRGPNSCVYNTGSIRFQIGYPATADLYDQTHINVAIFR